MEAKTTVPQCTRDPFPSRSARELRLSHSAINRPVVDPIQLWKVAMRFALPEGESSCLDTECWARIWQSV
jgi:hypothetical protein